MFVKVLNCHYPFEYYIKSNFFLLFAGLSLLLLCIYLVYLFRGNRQGFLGISLLYTGGMMNIVERYIVGCGIDYLDFFGLFKFNLYDVLVTCGVTLVLYNIWKKLT